MENSTKKKYAFKYWSLKAKLSLPILLSILISLAIWGVVFAYQKNLDQLTWISVLISLNFFLLWSLWFVINYYIAQPLKASTEVLQSLADGNLEVKLKEDTEYIDEISQVHHLLFKLTNSLQKAQEFTKNIGKGNFEVEQYNGHISEARHNGLFDSLMSMRDQLKTVAESERKRNWVTKGMAEFTKILRSDDTDLKELGRKIITGLVRYLNAHQGGIFVLNNEDPEERYLEMVACYAYDEAQYQQKRVQVEENFGEGLVGQTFLENETIYLRQIPEEYQTTIGSGLGDSRPRSILLVPLELNGNNEGVIEIASLRAFEDYEIEFVERLAENIASAILTIKINDHTKKLLKESQELTLRLKDQEQELRQNYEELQASQQEIEKKNQLIEEQKKEIEKALKEQTEKSEKLEAQEEEMRQNMEELVATQEQMMITQAELDGQLNAINKSSISKVELDLAGNIINANQSFCQLISCEIKQLKGQSYRKYADPEFASSDQYQAFWESLSQGNAQAGEYRLHANNAETYWINAVFSPVFNKKGESQKIIMLAFDVTDAKKLLEETQKQAKILQTQEEELRQNMEELKSTQEELNQKSRAIIELKEEEAKNARLKAKEIESKNQLITSSIQYAQNIQRAILPSEDKIREVIQDFFVIYLPKDIVSGDFYWFSQVEDKSFFAVVDCTGHGVPGAFMSIIGNTLLNEIVNVQKVLDPGKVLEKLHLGVRTKLRQEESSNHDGMDIVICRLEQGAGEAIHLTFAGAKRPLYYYRDQNLGELKGDRKSIGGWQREVFRTFQSHEITLQRGDSIFLTTDGLADNPNNRRKKFGLKRFKKIITENTHRPLKEQKLVMLDALVNHQQEAEQRDDITVLGIKL